MSKPRDLQTLGEFQEAIQRQLRFQNVHLVCVSLLFFGGFIVCYILPEPTFQYTIFGLMAATIISFIWSIYRIKKREQKPEAQLTCRNCGKSLFPQCGIVITTGNCPNCGKQAIDLSEFEAIEASIAPVPPRITRQEFLDADAQRTKQDDKIQYLVMFAMLALITIGSAIYINFIEPHTAKEYRRWLIIPFTLVPVLPLFYWKRKLIQRRHPYHELLICPSCNSELMSGLVSATGKCQVCQQVVFLDSVESISTPTENLLN